MNLPGPGLCLFPGAGTEGAQFLFTHASQHTFFIVTLAFSSVLEKNLVSLLLLVLLPDIGLAVVVSHAVALGHPIVRDS